MPDSLIAEELALVFMRVGARSGANRAGTTKFGCSPPTKCISDLTHSVLKSEVPSEHPDAEEHSV